jgi:hypothetical protein
MKKFNPLLLSLLGTFLSAAAITLLGLRKRESKPITKTSTDRKNNQSSPVIDKVYKTGGIKKVEIQEARYDRSINDIEFFIGTASVHPNEYDKYNVDILNETGSRIGHIENNHHLSNSLKEWHNGTVFTFGKIQIPNDAGTSKKGIAFIPIALEESMVNNLKLALRKLKKRHSILSEHSIPSIKYLKIIDDHKFISAILSQLGLTDEINTSLPKKIIPALSKQLEDEQDWDGLLKLEKYSDLIDELSERFAGTIYRRIGNAKKAKGQKQ